MRVTADDPSIAEVRMGALSKLEYVGMQGNQQTASALVVVGKDDFITPPTVRHPDSTTNARRSRRPLVAGHAAARYQSLDWQK